MIGSPASWAIAHSRSSSTWLGLWPFGHFDGIISALAPISMASRAMPGARSRSAIGT